MNLLRPATVVVALMLGQGLAFAASANEAGDQVFADRAPWTLDQGPLVWRLTVEGPASESFRPIENGTIELVRAVDPADGKPMLQILEKGGPIDRKLGPFPVDGGDPTVVFFLENVARDMAAITGGSPYYIRNRMKDALFRGGELRKEGGQTLAVFQPFREDKNKDRMGEFAQLELVFTLADPKAPIKSMVASTGGDKPTFRIAMVQP
ncbi:hypothetical protein [Paracoccus aminophilus]|uniref:Uncharacterized protein n=1 Tax=Paracoccus aminophilus JCM 7686 TaxID=1367847 RepID=S5XYN5_PARAH|nr:hypothetical protein [Paracoccus aminophilus]AGT10417.1 hypothetical protein JCM7686_3382 [Paracoccus aminophilus JCM 7686]